MTNSLAVIDANLVVHRLLVTPITQAALTAWDQLQQEQVHLYAPHLWCSEVTSAIRHYWFKGILTVEEAEQALQITLDLGVHLVDDEALALSALHWAERLGQRAAYDGFYLALAERLGAELWTADHRLAHRAQQLGLPWIRAVGET